ncbi:DUF2931 family protein [Sinomicrobium sp. M5D2P9]
MNIIRNIILVTVITGVLSCTSQTTMEKYEWIPSVSAPKNYPMEVYKGTFYYGDDSSVRIPAGHTLGAKNGQDWGMPGPSHYSDDDKREIPGSFDITWLSYRENKFYTGRFKLPEEKIAKLFREGFEDRTGKKKTYDVINVGMAPGGKVAVWMAGSGKKVEIDWFRAKDTVITKEEFMPDSEVSLEEHIRSTIEEDVKDAVRKEPVPLERWDTYRKRYQWHSEMVFSGQDETVSEILITYYNGEDLFTTGNNPEIVSYEERALPNHILVTWQNNKGDRYRMKAYFDEGEIFEAFKKAFAENKEERVQLVIRVEEGNTGARLFLKGEQEEIPIKKADVKVYPVSG